MEVHLHLFSTAEHPDSGVKPSGRDNHFPPADNLAVPGEEHLDEHRGATVSQHFHSWRRKRVSQHFHRYRAETGRLTVLLHATSKTLQDTWWGQENTRQTSVFEQPRVFGVLLYLISLSRRLWNICEQIYLDGIWDILYPQKTALMRHQAYLYCCISVEASILTLTQWAKTNSTVVKPSCRIDSQKLAD